MCQRDLWFINGVLDHKLNPQLLQDILEKFRRIDAVPQGYFYPELYTKLQPVSQKSPNAGTKS